MKDLSKIKMLLISTFSTTGITLVLLAVIRMFVGWFFIHSNTILEVLLVNFIIHGGLLVTGKIEQKYFAVNVLIDGSYTTLILLIFGYVFGWHGSSPLALVFLGVVIYVINLLLSTMRITSDISDINKLLKKRDK